MKNKIVTTATVIATLAGISHIARADGGTDQFTPIESLPPEIRQEISAKVFELTRDMDVDWDNVAVGLDDNGKISLRPRSDKQMTAGSFSCAAARSSFHSEEK